MELSALAKYCKEKKLIVKKIRKAAKIQNRYNQVPHLTQDTTWESDKNIIKHHKREPIGQPFPSK